MLPKLPADSLAGFPIICSFKGCSQSSIQAHATKSLPVDGVSVDKQTKASRQHEKKTFFAVSDQG